LGTSEDQPDKKGKNSINYISSFYRNNLDLLRNRAEKSMNRLWKASRKRGES
jgi:hypothetical protein